ncbi:MAG: anti-sigma regulatory factor [Terriglobales bacterium]
MINPERVTVHSDADVVIARQRGREIASLLGFSASDLALIATAISELARNIVLYAGTGEIEIGRVDQKDKQGIEIVARDQGPGISNVPQAMRDGFSTSGGLGLGLPGVKRLMDDFEIDSRPGRGTRVTVRRWTR